MFRTVDHGQTAPTYMCQITEIEQSQVMSANRNKAGVPFQYAG